MNRFYALIFVVVMILTFTACGDKEKAENTVDATKAKVSSSTTKNVKKESAKESTTAETTKDLESTSANSDKQNNSVSSSNNNSSNGSVKATTTTTTKKAVANNVISNNLMSSFSTYDMNDNAVNQSILSGKKVTMFNVWWTQCSPCIAEMPDLSTLNAKYSNFQVIGIVWDYTNTSSVNSIISQTGANYTHIQMDNGIYSKVTAAGYGGYVPFTFFVDQNGNQLKFTCSGQVVSSVSGAQNWEPIIQELLG